MPTVVTLVHGTWAPQAAWTRGDSALSRALRARLGDDTPLRAYTWSGDNSFAARSQAAAGLAGFLRDGIERFPHHRQVIVAHSHGGNVALGALKDAELAAQVSDVVCLATPFVTTRPRQFGAHSAFATGYATLIACLFVGLAFSWAVVTALGAGREGAWGLLALVLAVLGGGGAWWVLSRVAGAWQRHAHAWSERTGVTAPPAPTRLLIIRAAGDEAAEGLAAFHLPTTLLMLGWRLLARMSIAPLSAASRLDHWARSRLHGRLLLAAGAWLLVAAGWHWGFPDAPEERKTMLLAYLAVLLVLGALTARRAGLLELIAFTLAPLFVVLGLAFVLMLVALGLALLPFNSSVRGLGAFVASALWLGPIDVTAEAAPPGCASMVRQLSADSSETLRHSLPYSDPEAIGWTTDWLAARAEPAA